MATIVLHAGMPKAGSSSIQTWLRANIAGLRDEFHIEPLVFRSRRGDSSPGGLTRYENGSLNSGAFLFRYLISDRDPSVISQLTEPLDQYARQHESVLLSSEAFATLFAEVDMPFLEGLERLAREHTVRVAYYVRAQHESLEAAWRQWGFRSGRSPSDYVGYRERLLSYDRTRDGVARHAPHVSFEIRMFPPGEPQGTLDTPGTRSVVDDFARIFLGATRTVDEGRTWANPGLPLEVVNSLRYAPEGWFWESQDDNLRLQWIKELVARVNIAESPEVRESRQLLHRYCFDRYAASNRALADALGWPRLDLVPPVADVDGPAPELESLDSLWACRHDDVSRMALFTALHAAVNARRSKDKTDSAPAEVAVDALLRFFDASPVEPAPTT